MGKGEQTVTEFLKLKASNCKNCYKCIRHCPVKSIRFTGHQAHIVTNECILCGQCFVVCPQNAKEIVDDTEKAKVLISSNETVIASIAPSFAANYAVGIESMEKALKRLGFAAAEETAVGAAMVKTRYEELIQEGGRNVIISSCCPTVNLLIEKHYPQALPYLAEVITPMEAHCKDIKRRYKNAKTIFIGPCISKKEEADSEDAVDCVLTFDELDKWLEREGVRIEKTDEPVNIHSRTRLFPTAGGILKSMACDAPDYHYLTVDGIENCISAVEDIIQGKLSNCFVEMSSCTGSCIGGPVMRKEEKGPVRSYLAVADYAGEKDFVYEKLSQEEITKERKSLRIDKQMPGHSAIEEILRQMGKTKPEDELNCGSCGYNTCREKAVAVYQGKADLTMCLPFLKEKAENFSDNIIRNTPNGIIVLNDMLEVQQINSAALKILNIASSSYVLGEQVIRILDPVDFVMVKQTGEDIRDNRIYLAEYKKYVEQTIIYDKEYRIFMCIMRDVTDEEQEREKRENMMHHTVEITDKVVEKQMRVVQEIASLLGETTAETKIALSKLKESLTDE